MPTIKVTKHTGIEAARRAIAATVREKGFASKATLKMIYRWMHSPIRTQIFEINIENIPSYVSTHLARHVTVQPYITTARTDRGGTGKEGRMSPVDMTLWANAEALINMARKRLCFQADHKTLLLVKMIQTEIAKVDPDLAYYMVPECVFCGGYCKEPKPCGVYDCKVYDPAEIQQRIMKRPEGY